MNKLKQHEKIRVFEGFAGYSDLKYSILNTKDYGIPQNRESLGILVDTRYLINEYAKHDQSQIDRLSEIIETSLEYYRSITE